MMMARHRRPLFISVALLAICVIISTFYFQNESLSNLYNKIKFPGVGGDEDLKSPRPSNAVTTTLTSSASQPPTSIIPETPQQTTVLEGSESTNDDFSALRKLCSETRWTPGLWLHCHSTCGSDHTSVCGGLNNARNRIQTCLRYAIDAGAGLIVPSVTTRSESHLKDTDGGTICASMFWDMRHLKSELEKYCPQLDLLFCDDRAGINTVLQAPHRDYADAPHHKGTFAAVVNNTLVKHGINPGRMLSQPVVVNFADSLMGWSYSRSDELWTIRKDLYKVLQYNRDLLEVSYQILGHPQLGDGQFIGVHLRGENDWPEDFGSAEDQMRLYKEEIELLRDTGPNHIKVVYVSCGDEEVIKIFRQILAPLGYIVHDKWTLLADNEEMLDLVDNLPFDEKAIVEYETLVHSKYFLGPAMSSMSSLIAYERTLDEEKDIFTTHIFPGSVRDEETRWRTYPNAPAMMGDETTKLMVVNQFDIMDNFP